MPSVRFDALPKQRVVARAREEAPISMERDEVTEIARLAVFECVREVCEQHPELHTSWYAISPRR